MKKLWSIALVLILAFFLAACSSDDTTTEAPEENNNEASETNETDETSETNDAPATTGSGLTNLAITEKISAEWALTGHADTGNALARAGMRDNCAACHSGNGFLQQNTDDPYTPGADEEAGEDVALPRTMDCATCHTGLGQEILETGVTEVPFVEGSYDAGKGTALCISCHNGRQDTSDLYQQWYTGEGQPTGYPHYDSGALFSGKGGMEYPDVNYANTAAHQNGGCVSCHMPETEDGYVSHNFSMDPADIDTACGTCHQGATDFAVGGNLQAELDELLEELHELAVAAVDGAEAVGTSRLLFPFVDANGERVDLDNVSVEAFVGAYNYYLIYSDRSGGAHNPAYAKSLLQESINALK